MVGAQTGVRVPSFVVIAPTFNNAGTLEAVLRSVEGLGFALIVVNDGSTDATSKALEAWCGERGTGENRNVIHHDHNRGKADALRTGFAEAARLGFSHAITIDTDGQHDAADLVKLVAMAKSNPAAMVVGARPTDGGAYPIKSRVGRSISNALVRAESGARVSDSQCGMRVYPLASTRTLACAAGRYGFETEILARAAWAGIALIEAPIRCIYHVAGGRVSHFRPVRDSMSAIAMHARLLLASIGKRAKGRRARKACPAPAALRA